MIQAALRPDSCLDKLGNPMALLTVGEGPSPVPQQARLTAVLHTGNSPLGRLQRASARAISREHLPFVTPSMFSQSFQFYNQTLQATPTNLLIHK